MANIIRHRFASAKSDGGDATQVQPSHWNDGHMLTGGNAGDVLTRDPTDATFGAKWSPFGTWVDIPFSAANFSATGSMVWAVTAGNVKVNRYTLIGKTMLWMVVVDGASIGGAPSGALAMVPPAGLTLIANRGPVAVAQMQDGVWVNGMVYPVTGGIYIQKVPYANFTVNTGNTYVYFTAILELA